MDKIEIWLYIIFGVVYFLSRIFKKAAPQGDANVPSPEAGRAERPSDPEGPRPMTFEELLREITQGHQTRQEPAEKAAEEQVAEEAERPAWEEPVEERPVPVSREVVSEPAVATRNPAWAAYEQVPANPERISLEQTLRAGDVRREAEHTKSLVSREKDTSRAEHYRKILADPQSLKEAIVLGEILNRKF